MATQKKSVPAVKLKRLGMQSPTFTIPLVVRKFNGTTAKLVITVKGLKKTEWAELREQHRQESMGLIKQDAAADGATEEPQTDDESASESLIDRFGVDGVVNRAIARHTSLVMKFATGWDLEDEFTAENLHALEDEFGGTLEDVINSYERAVYHGILGN